MQRIKSAQLLFKREAKRLAKYNKDELLGLLSNTDVHSPELTDSNNPNREFNVFNYT